MKRSQIAAICLAALLASGCAGSSGDPGEYESIQSTSGESVIASEAYSETAISENNDIPNPDTSEEAVNGGYASARCLSDFINGRGDSIQSIVDWIKRKTKTAS